MLKKIELRLIVKKSFNVLDKCKRKKSSKINKLNIKKKDGINDIDIFLSVFLIFIVITRRIIAYSLFQCISETLKSNLKEV